MSASNRKPFPPIPGALPESRRVFVETLRAKVHTFDSIRAAAADISDATGSPLYSANLSEWCRCKAFPAKWYWRLCAWLAMPPDPETLAECLAHYPEAPQTPTPARSAPVTLPEALSKAIEDAGEHGATRFWIVKTPVGPSHVLTDPTPATLPVLRVCELRERDEWVDVATGAVVGRAQGGVGWGGSITGASVERYGREKKRHAPTL